jgi:hypothetical protein
MKSCAACGAEYSDEEAERISNESTRVFTAEQLAIIKQHEAETEEP